MTLSEDQLLDVEVAKAVIVNRFFVDTADANYLTARWCFSNKELQLEFKWQALHSLEKYLKAALLFNGKSAKNYGHNLSRAFCNLKGVAKNLLDVHTLQIETLIKHLEIYGCAQNRYNLYGNEHGSVELSNLDLAVFHIRRLICPLDVQRDSGKTYGEELASDPQFYFRNNNRLLETAVAIESHPLHHIACDRNTFFAPANYQHSAPLSPSISATSSIINDLILNPMRDAQNANDWHISSELTDWIIKNIQLNHEDEAELVKEKNGKAISLNIEL